MSQWKKIRIDAYVPDDFTDGGWGIATIYTQRDDIRRAVRETLNDTEVTKWKILRVTVCESADLNVGFWSMIDPKCARLI